MLQKFLFLFFFLLLPGCAFLDGVQEEDPSGSTSGSPALSGFRKYESLHFVVYGYDDAKNSEVAETAESVYKKIMFDANLLSYKPRENYRITLYRDKEEYSMKTGYPSWSGGGTMTTPLGQVLPSDRDVRARTSIATFETGLSPALLAHEVSHLVFNEFMSFDTQEKSAQILWLNEGLATYEELQAYTSEDRSDYSRLTRSLLKTYATPLAELVRFRPIFAATTVLGTYSFGGRRYDFTNIDVWYWQVRTLTEFLIQKQGQYNFYLLLDGFKKGKDFSQALESAYPGKWRNLNDLEGEWKQWL